MIETIPEPISPFKAICLRVMDDWLFIQYPTIFRVRSPIPLALGTGNELIAQLPETITKTEFRAAMRWYCGRESYLQAVLKGTQRINLQGELVGEIAELDKISALKRKTVEPVAEVITPVKTVPAPVKAPKGNIATAKGLKVTLVVEPASIPNIDSTGMKKVTLTVQVTNTDIQVTADLSAKSYRKAMSGIEEFGVEGCNAILQGSMKQYGVIDDAGLVVQPKKVANSGE